MLRLQLLNLINKCLWGNHKNIIKHTTITFKNELIKVNSLASQPSPKDEF